MTLTHAQKLTQNNILHVAFAVDRSDSMSWYGHSKKVVSVVDRQVARLKERSKDEGLEIRVSVYIFDHEVECVYYDKDVFRLPSMAGKYQTRGATALIDATWLMLDDLEMTPQKYGVHNFLAFALTDGENNRGGGRAEALRQRMHGMPDNFTLSCLVPDDKGERAASQFGFNIGNIKQWNATSEEGFEKAMEDVGRATDHFIAQTVSGIGFRGTKTLFSGGVDQVNHQTVKTQLAELTGPHQMIHVSADDHRTKTKDFVLGNGLEYVSGKLFYQLTKPEKIQAYKNIIIRDKKTKVLYHGPQARSILLLPAEEKRVKPDVNPLYDVFVQSTNGTRLLMEHTDVVVLDPIQRR